MRRLFWALVNCCYDFIRFVYFLTQICLDGFFSNPIRRKYAGTVVVLGNGPSLKEALPFMEQHEAFKNVDFAVVNMFPSEEIFFKIKPKHYFITRYDLVNDVTTPTAMFEMEQRQKVHANLQDRVDWELNLYIYRGNKRKFLEFSKITNKNIQISGVGGVPYTGYESFRNFFYAKGLSMPLIANSVNLAIYAMINSGYSNILLYGVDFDVFKNILVDEKNQIRYAVNHFYGDNQQPVTPYLNYKNMNRVKMSEFFTGILDTFKSHDLLSNYADSQNVNIINCTRDSYIDSYRRIPHDVELWDMETILKRCSTP